MQKSKSATVGIIIIIIIYTISRVTLISKLNTIYTYIVNPLFWIILALALYKLLGKTHENKKIKRQSTEYTLVACLLYIIIYLISGLFVTFGKNPYSTTVRGVITNIWILGIPILFREYIRYKLINNVYDRDKNKMTIVITIVFILLEYDVRGVIGKEITFYFIFMQLFEQLVPITSKNVLYSYLAMNRNCSVAIIYEFITKLYVWISPILPNSPWIMDSIIDTTIPIILFIYIRYASNKASRFRTKEKIINSDPKNVIPLITIIVLSIWFAIGVFPIKPVSIASGSMKDELDIGDVVIIKKCTPKDVNVGDIIEYETEERTIIHRVIEKKQVKGKYYFKTKGDNNQAEDKKEVSQEQLIGKVIFKIRYIGYPALWLNKVEEEK